MDLLNTAIVFALAFGAVQILLYLLQSARNRPNAEQQKANSERYEERQKVSMELYERSTLAHEKSAAALDRIATALEQRKP
jgi:hypothetical protein